MGVAAISCGAVRGCSLTNCSRGQDANSPLEEETGILSHEGDTPKEEEISTANLAVAKLETAGSYDDLLAQRLAAKQAVRAKTAPSREAKGLVHSKGADGHKIVGKEADPYTQVLVLADGSSYVGQLRDGLPHGHGCRRAPRPEQSNAEVVAAVCYQGQWSDGKQHGDGRQEWEDGRIYEGQFYQDRFHGHGRMEWHTCKGIATYEGQYVQDVKHGQGRYAWCDGRVYDGQWVDGRRDGIGQYTSQEGATQTCRWKNDVIEV